MNISIGLLDFGEEKRIQQQIYASAFCVGTRYPTNTFNADTPMDFFKSVILEMIEHAEKPKFDLLYKQKIEKSEKNIKQLKQTNPSIDTEQLTQSAIKAIKHDINTRKLFLKQKVMSPLNDAKIITAANVGAAFTLERKDKLKAQELPLTKRLGVQQKYAVMPFVVVDTTKDVLKRIKEGYSRLVLKHHSNSQQSESILELLSSRSLLHKEGDIEQKAAQKFSSQDNPEIFNDMLNKHKGQDMSPQFLTTQNKRRIKL